MRQLITTLFLFFFCVFTWGSTTETLSCSPLLFQNSTPKREVRAVWITTYSNLDWPKTKAVSAISRKRQQEEFCTMLNQLQTLHINTILLQTRIRGSVIYPSSLEPWDQSLTGSYGETPGYDPLQFAITEAHKRGMELHAWIVTIPCFKQVQAKKMTSSVLKKQPNLCVKHGDTWYLNPGMPGTSSYLTRLVHEIVANYDVDGIHLDYIRYPEKVSFFKDDATYKRYASKYQSKADWRRQNITTIVRNIYRDVKAMKPWVRVSSSPIGKYADLTRFSSKGWNARDAVFQDAEAWCNEGIHDMLFPMMYFDGDNFYPFAADWQEHANHRIIAPGLGAYCLDEHESNWSLSTIVRQLSFIRQCNISGQCFFRAQFLLNNSKGICNYLQNTYYPYLALTPAMTWIDKQAPTPPHALQTRLLNDNTSELSWEPSTDNLPGIMRYNIYAAKTDIVDVTDARNLIATAVTTESYRYNHLTTYLYGYNIAVTAMDRCGNESTAVQLKMNTPLWKHNLIPLPSPSHR